MNNFGGDIMFKLLMRKYVKCFYNKGCGCKSTMIIKELELPFVPMRGLIISDKGFEDRIINLYWHNDLQKFITELSEEEIINEKANTIEECLYSELQCGWEIE
jgi:hypothetical protein